MKTGRSGGRRAKREMAQGPLAAWGRIGLYPASLLLALGALAACGGKASIDDATTGGAPGSSGGAGGSAGVAGAASGGASAGGASSGGSSAVGGAPATECVPKGDGWSSNIDPTCDDLAVLAVQSPVLVDDSGDGVVSPGEGFSLNVVLAEVAGEGFSVYPGVKFASDNPLVTISENDWFYGIFACQSYETGGHGAVAVDVAPGTVVKLTARVAMLNTDCPNAPSVSVELTVK